MNPSEVTGIGLDLGSTTAKYVLLEHGVIKDKQLVRSHQWKGFVDRNVPEERKDVFSTGYFRKNVESELAITEITAAKAGASFVFPDVDIDVILDIGGQDTKVIEVKTNRFIMNDKCSAGTGAFLEFTAKYFDIPLEDLNVMQEKARDPVEINNTCGVFAISEMISHLVNGRDRADVIAGMHLAWAKRIAQLLPEEGMSNIVVIGGGARNIGVCKYLEQELGGGVFIMIPKEPDLVNAVGAVVYGCAQKS